MVIRINKKSIFKICTVALACVGLYALGQKGYQQYQYHQLAHVSANTTLYRTDYRADLKYLHHGGNKLAIMTNRQHAELSTNNRHSKHSYDYYMHKDPVYRKGSDGNYWSYLYNHHPIGNDLFDLTTSDGNSATTSEKDKNDSGVIANEAVLRNHGVRSGVNFDHTSDD